MATEEMLGLLPLEYERLVQPLPVCVAPRSQGIFDLACGAAHGSVLHGKTLSPGLGKHHDDDIGRCPFHDGPQAEHLMHQSIAGLVFLHRHSSRRFYDKPGLQGYGAAFMAA